MATGIPQKNTSKESTAMTFRPRQIDRERVARGAAILDQKFPGWEKLVNWQTLQISSSSDCVLAQVGRPMTECFGGDWDRNYLAFQLAERRCVPAMLSQPWGLELTEYGFNVDYGCGGSNQRLQLAWKTEIEARLHKPKPKKRADFVLAA